MILLHHSTLVAKRTGGDCIVFLFQLEYFYVEMICNLSTKKVEEYMVFENTTQLHPYLESIPIHDIFSHE